MTQPIKSALLDKVRRAGAPYGLNLAAATSAARYDSAVTTPYRTGAVAPGAKSIVVIANGGGSFWNAFERFADAHAGWRDRANPLDDFTRQIVDREIAPLVPGARVFYPFMNDSRALNFIELGKAAGLAGPSILGVLVHPTFGPWIAFRAALLIDELIDDPGDAAGFDPCPSCTTRSCIAACPVGAVAFPSGWDIPRCLTYRVESEADCAPRCHARAACVIGPKYRYPDRELAYHQARALGAMRPWYEKNIRDKGR